MANTVTLADIKTQARQRADMENSEFISDSELLSYINSSYAELYDLIVSRFEDYYVESTELTITSGNSTITLPSDFYKLKGLDRKYGSSTEYCTVERFDWKSRNQRNSSVARSSLGVSNTSYRIVKDEIRILPEADAPGTYRLWYIPTFTRLSDDADTVDGVNGWEEYIVIDAAIKMMQKEESDVSVLAAQKNMIVKRVEDMAQQRDADMPETISDVQSLGWEQGFLPWR